jgi:hypothetical protein
MVHENIKAGYQDQVKQVELKPMQQPKIMDQNTICCQNEYNKSVHEIKIL